MKKKNLLALLFALIFIFTSVFPAFAEEGDVSPAPEQEEETLQLPEDDPDVSDPDHAPDPDEEPPDPIPEDPDEGEDVPPTPEKSQDPDTEETPDTDDDEDPDAPQDPADGETPDEDEEPPEDPVDEENPDEEVPDEEDPGEESDPDAEEESPVIDVFVPASGQVIINPYHMKVSASTGETRDQVVHEPQALISDSDFPLLVTAQAVGFIQPGSASRFVAAPPADDAMDKEIFMYVEFQNDPTFWTGAYGDWPNQILVTDWGMEKVNVMALDAFGVGYFRLFGAMTNYPDTMWAAEDAPDVIIAFSFAEIPGVAETDTFPEPFALPEVPPENIPEAFPQEFPEVPSEAEDTEMY
ncbi:MAG: hypothetical protein HDT20_08745 [Oscillibacter sp.]|nr:hypothetical protein [Oscillibacter sp.]